MLRLKLDRIWAMVLCTALFSLFLVAAAHAADAPKTLKELVEVA